MNKIISFFIGIILFSSALVSSKLSFMIIVRNLTLFLFLIFIIFSFLVNKRKIKVNRNQILWIIFTLSVFISNFYNENDIINGIFLVIGVTGIYFYYLPNKCSNNLLGILTNNILVVESIILILCLFSSSIVLPYKGIFLNSNTLALNLLLLGVAINIKIDVTLSESVKKIIIYKLYLLVVILFIFSTESRTSLITILLLSLFNILKSLKNRKNFIELIISMLLIIFLFKLYYNKNPEIINAIFEKTHNSKNLFSGRGYIWSQTINDYNIFGHGKNYFENTYGLGAHNSIIKILGENGVVSVVIYILICIFSLFKSIKYIIKTNEKYKFAPFYIIISYLIVSITEGLFSAFGNAYMVSFFIILGYLTNREITVSGG